MKFFTREWWASEGEDLSVFDRYETYLNSVTTFLPKDLLRLRSEHTLHDAEVKSIHSVFDTKTVKIELRGWDMGFQTPTSYMLSFSGVSEFDQVFPQQQHVEAELGDLGYWEIEAVDMGTEVRMLFVSDAQFRIVFQGFSFEHSTISA